MGCGILSLDSMLSLILTWRIEYSRVVIIAIVRLALLIATALVFFAVCIEALGISIGVGIGISAGISVGVSVGVNVGVNNALSLRIIVVVGAADDNGVGRRRI